ncbi:MAG: AidA/PixA family protein [Limnohabitans sp.]|nr:AidA/PixA family protein [Limnohabitans sp.]
MATIDILCVIDTNYLMQKFSNAGGTLTSPYSLGSFQSSDSFVFLIADGQYTSNNPDNSPNNQNDTGQGKSELQIDASIGDTIRWTITDPSLGLVADQESASYSCILYGFNTGSSGILTAPVCNSLPAIMYYNSIVNPNQPVAAAYMCSSWTASVLTTGTVQYTWNFQVVDNSSGNVVGYFSWDPFIQINS